jgi:hypothetical protein
VVSLIVRLLRIASFVICAIVIASFAIFVVDQTKTASKHQTEEVSSGPPVASTQSPGESGSATKSSNKPGSAHKAIDEASDELTSPFAGLVSGSSSEWLTRGVKLLLALAIYGFGLSYLARVLRVRV